MKGKSEKLYQIGINTNRKRLIKGDTRPSPKLMLMDMQGMENDYVHTLTGGTMETIPIPGILSPSRVFSPLKTIRTLGTGILELTQGR